MVSVCKAAFALAALGLSPSRALAQGRSLSPVPETQVVRPFAPASRLQLQTPTLSSQLSSPSRTFSSLAPLAANLPPSYANAALAAQSQVSAIALPVMAPAIMAYPAAQQAPALALSANLAVIKESPKNNQEARSSLQALAAGVAQTANRQGALSAFYHQARTVPDSPILVDATAPDADADRFIDDFLKKRIRDVSLRDGHQSWDGNRWRIEERVAVARLIDKLGLHSVESGGGADYDVATIMGENPWENLRQLTEAFANTAQQWLFRGRNALGLGPQPQDVIVAMVEHAVLHGVKRIRVFDGMNDVDNVQSTVDAVNAIRERMAGMPEEAKPLVEGAMAYTVDRRNVPREQKVWSVDAFVEQAKAMKAMGVHVIAVKDMAGVLTEAEVEELVTKLHQEVGLPISIHSHSSSGRAEGVLLKALETGRKVGADVVVDAAIGDLSQGPSHPDIRAILKAELKRAGFSEEQYKNNSKIKLLDEIAGVIRRQATKYKPGRIRFDAEMSMLLDLSGIPGGMVGTTAKMVRPYLADFRRRLKRPDLTVEDILREGLRRVPKVREDAGLPPLVTPMSQFVLMQAIYNFRDGDYATIVPQFAQMMLGRFGKIQGPQNAALLKRLPRLAPPKPLEPKMPELTARAAALKDRTAQDLREATLLLVARNGHAVLTGDASKFEPPAREGPRTHAEIEEALGELPRVIAEKKRLGLDASEARRQALARLDNLGLERIALVGARLILDELISKAPPPRPLGPLLNKRLANLPPYIFARLKAWAREAAAAGHDVIDLGQGSPDLPAPEGAVDALAVSAREVKNHTYPRADGSPEFRQALARWYKKRFGVELDPEKEILPLLGSKEGIGHLLLAMLEPGDGVLVPSPGYPAYPNQVIAAGGQPFPMRLSEQNGFLPDFNALEAQLQDAESRGHKVRAMILNYPSNPTGAVADLAFLERARAFARKHGLWVLYDNAYSEISFDGYNSPTMLQVPGAYENTIEFHTFSKGWSMAGFRIGFAVGNAKAIAALAKVKGFFDYGIPSFNQAAAIAALAESDSYVPKARATYETRRDALVQALREIGWQVRPPQGAMYLWAKLPPSVRMSSLEFSERLIREQGVVVSPGSAFGPDGEGYIRISLIQPPERLREAVRRIGEFLKSLEFLATK